MKESYTVVIEKRHITGRYDDIYNCPLCEAIKEQAPELNLDHVGVFNLCDKSRTYYLFDYKKWNAEVFKKLNDGKIKSIILEIWKSGKDFNEVIDKPEPQTAKVVKEYVVVTVDKSLSEQSKELITEN